MLSSRIIKKVPRPVSLRAIVVETEPVSHEVLSDGGDDETDSVPEVTGKSEGQRELEGQAGEIIDSANAEAARILGQAREDAIRIREEAHQQGYQQGLESGYGQAMEEGIAAGRAELAEEIGRLKSIAQGAGEFKAGVLKNSESEAVELIIEIARKVIKKELATDPSIITRVVSSAIQKVIDRDIVKIRISSDDYELLNEHWSAVGENAPGKWEFIIDNRIKPGGCILETKSGLVDAQIETQLAEIERSFQALTEAGNH